LNIQGQVDPEILQRGIYEAVVYSAKLDFSGKFKKLDFAELNISSKDVIWEEAVLSVSIPDTRGINEGIIISWDSKDYTVSPGLGAELGLANSYLSEEFNIKQRTMAMDEGGTGVNTKVILDTNNNKVYPFSFNININGSEELNFIPLGSVTEVNLNSSWTSPSFGGAFLPDSRELSNNGFESNWKVLQLNRNYPQVWSDQSKVNMNSSAFGVNLLNPVDEYQKNTRSVKYAIMIIALIFLIFFFVEVMNRIRIHPIQYILVGLSIVLFFSLLLSLSEHLNFNLAYLIASVSTILMITLYSKTIFKNTRLTLLQGGILLVMYIFIFTILQLQDYSLLMGSLGLFVVLATVMYISRKIDWYSAGLNKDNK
jgi:inner membrane protein